MGRSLKPSLGAPESIVDLAVKIFKSRLYLLLLCFIAVLSCLVHEEVAVPF